MDLKAIMQKYSEELEIPGQIPQNSEGAYEIPISDMLTIKVHNSDSCIKLTCHLGDFPLDRDDKFLYELMMGNLYGIVTKGAVLGLTPDGKSILLLRDLPDNLSYEQFMGRYEVFCGVAESWQEAARKKS